MADENNPQGPQNVTMTAPLSRDVDGAGRRGHLHQNFDVGLSIEEAHTLRDLQDGLRAAGVFSLGGPTSADAVRWMLRTLGEARALGK